MDSTDPRPQPRHGEADTDDRFDVLRARYRQRLGGDRTALRGLRTELRRAEADAAPAQEKLRMLAHRMAGAAALFADRGICSAASALESAATAALEAHADKDDAKLWRAARALTALLDRTDDAVSAVVDPGKADHGRFDHVKADLDGDCRSR